MSFPALSNPANNHRAVPLPVSLRLHETAQRGGIAGNYEKLAVPGPDHVLFQAAFANFNPHAATAVNFQNEARAPLLLISGGNDHVSPASIVEANFKLYGKSKAVTEYRNFPGRTHYTLGQDGWEEVADYALTWLETKSGNRSVQASAE